MRDEVIKEAVSQLLALVTFFAFPAIQYLSLKWFARKEGEPELWFLPRYDCFRLVIRNIPGSKILSELKLRSFLRKIVRSSEGSSVAAYMDDGLTDAEDFFLFPGNDQVILSFRIEGPDESHLNFVLTDKLGVEKRSVGLSSIDLLIADYSGTLENFLNFDVKLAKRAEIRAETLVHIWKETQKNNVESQFDLDRVRSVG